MHSRPMSPQGFDIVYICTAVVLTTLVGVALLVLFL